MVPVTRDVVTCGTAMSTTLVFAVVTANYSTEPAT